VGKLSVLQLKILRNFLGSYSSGAAKTIKNSFYNTWEVSRNFVHELVTNYLPFCCLGISLARKKIYYII